MTISQNFKLSKTCHLLQKSIQLSFGDRALRYHRNIKHLILERYCRYPRFPRHLNMEITQR